MVDVVIDASTSSVAFQNAIKAGPVWTSPTTGYVIYNDSGEIVRIAKTTDTGATWASAALVHDSTGSVVKISWWYDRWTNGDSGTEIHIAFMETTDDDIKYNSFNTSDDSLSGEVIVHSGTAVSTGSHQRTNLSIVKARGANLYIAGRMDNVGTDEVFYRSTDGGVIWTSQSALVYTNSGSDRDRVILQPGDAADDNDVMGFLFDHSGLTYERALYDDSGNTWTFTDIKTGLDASCRSNDFFSFGVANRHSDDHSIFAGWTHIDPATAIADLEVWDVASGSITARTNARDDVAEQAWASVFIDQQNDDIYIAHLDGTALGSAVRVKYVLSVDDASTWAAAVTLDENAEDDQRAVWTGDSVGDDGGNFMPDWTNDDLNDLLTNTNNSVGIPEADNMAWATGEPQGVERLLVVRSY